MNMTSLRTKFESINVTRCCIEIVLWFKFYSKKIIVRLQNICFNKTMKCQWRWCHLVSANPRHRSSVPRQNTKLTNCGLVTPYGVVDMSQQRFRWSPVWYQAITWTNCQLDQSNNLQWSLNQNEIILIEENAFAKVVCKMSTILFRPQWARNIFIPEW